MAESMATFVPNGLQLSGFSPTKFQQLYQTKISLSRWGRINPATPFHPWTKVAGFSGYSYK